MWGRSPTLIIYYATTAPLLETMTQPIVFAQANITVSLTSAKAMLAPLAKVSGVTVAVPPPSTTIVMILI
jgi:hypothetical protein